MQFSMNRRTLLKALASQAVFVPFGARFGLAQDEALFISAYADKDDHMWVGGIDVSGKEIFRHALPARAHGMARRPGTLEAAVFARRPGDYVAVIDLFSGNTVHEVKVPENRRFYGHGAFSLDGRYLFTTENDFDGEKGVIGIWDAKDNYKRIGEHKAYGIGPHQIELMPDGQTLVVAVGGILTHPDEGRRKLNIPDMEPALVYLDARSGQLVNRLTLPHKYHKLSIRHLAVTRQGQVFAGLQNQGPKHEVVPLAITHFGKGELTFLEAGHDVWQRQKNYVGSVIVDSGSAVVGMTSPRGNCIEFWNIEDGRHIGSTSIPDVCGLAPTKDLGVFLATSGAGGVYRIDAYSGRNIHVLEPRDDFRRWDNHMLRII
ncbi:DUF1513 domain-containing protein [Aestuariispira ectoiniformans]|uniref:DUF1513 domain-containing protein n=1 Tax=Aestuariispira ectoiniformans TaxID=2775080 RepID=UPI00223BE04F|nr:DUF1513 domain-containing protein [Aestuariispira ectoiniformans]